MARINKEQYEELKAKGRKTPLDKALIYDYELEEVAKAENEVADIFACASQSLSKIENVIIKRKVKSLINQCEKIVVSYAHPEIV